MRRLRGWLFRILGAFQDKRREREFAAELDANLQLDIEEGVRSGLSPDEARRRALVRVGRPELMAENYREQAGLPFLETLMHDVRYGLRQLRRSPGFAVVAVLTLALCVGANTAMFTVVNAVLLRDLPYVKSERLVRLQGWHAERKETTSVSPRLFDGWRRDLRGIDGIAAYHGFDTFILNSDRPERLSVLRVSPNFFDVLGIRPVTGRAFAANEEMPGSDAVVILGNGLWKRQFASDASIVNRAITMNGRSYTVIGVMPEGFRFESNFDAWVPFGPELEAERRRLSYLRVIGRLKDGTTVEQARAQMEAATEALARQYPDSKFGVRLQPLKQLMVADARPALLMLFGAVVFVLLIGCANVANLLFARGTAREREMALRVALGAGRARLIRQLLTESLVLAAIGGGLGVALSRWGVQLLLSLESGLPRASEVSPDAWVFAFSIAVSLVAGLVFGCLPAYRSSSVDINGVLKESGALGGGGRRRFARRLLVACEIALSVMLLIGAGLLMRSFWRLQNVDPGFKREGLLAFRLAAPGASAGQARTQTQAGSKASDTRAGAFFQDVLSRMQAIPGVSSVATINELPFGNSRTTFSFEIPERPETSRRMVIADVRMASTDYFRTMGIPLVLGRTFTEQDRGDAGRVAVINDYMARRFWPGDTPIGRTITLGSAETHFQIVGVVGNVKNGGLTSEPTSEIYLSWDPFTVNSLQQGRGEMYFAVATTRDPLSLVPDIRAAVQRVDKGQPVFGIMTMRQAVERTIAEDRSNMLLVSSFAGVALLLAAIGIYGVVAYLVEQRTHEIGVRMALGAKRVQVLFMVIGQGSAMVLAGLAVGSIGALAASSVMRRFLFGVAPNDWRTFAAVAVLLAAVALLATYIPARRATRVDPLIALRHE